MKINIIFFIFCFTSVTISDLHAQSVVAPPKKNDLLSASNGKWDLNKYIWSQTHINEKGDKPVLDFEALDNWVQLDNSRVSISPDGKYFAYGKFKGENDLPKDDSLIIQATENEWKKVFSTKINGVFSLDSKQYIFKEKDDLIFVRMGYNEPRYVHSVASYKASSGSNIKWIAYQLKNNSSTVVLENLITSKEKRIDNVLAYSFDKSGKWLACQIKQNQLLIYDLQNGTELFYTDVDSYSFDDNGISLLLKGSPIDENTTFSLRYVNLQNKEVKTIWTSGKNETVASYQLDKSGRQVVFVVSETSAKDGDKSIWYYKEGMGNAVEKLNNQTAGIQQPLYIQGSASFTDNGHYIQFGLKTSKEIQQAALDAVKLDVWNYKDILLQSVQMNKKEVISFQAVFNIESDKLIQLEDTESRLSELKGDFALVRIRRLDQSDHFWESDYWNDNIWLVSLKDNSRRLLPVSKSNFVWLSPCGNYLVYFDGQHGSHYFISYNFQTRKQTKISRYIQYRELDEPTSSGSFGIAGWVHNDTSVLVYDNYDIWKLDLAGIKQPFCITNGYGRKNNTMFSWLEKGRNSSPNFVYNSNDTLLLFAFNRTNKRSGFYNKILSAPGDPELLYDGSYFFQPIGFEPAFSYGMQPIRATQSSIWIVQRQTATDAPNYFLTNDFKAFKQLTNLQPQQSHNWLSAELHSFKRLDGSIGQGILYKPENFDPKKKYPLIIGIYEQQASQLYQFPQSGYVIDASIFREGLAWMISHEYLVFLPDNLFTKAGWGPNTVSTAVGAANYLSKLPFVDSTKLGACGHSNGGRTCYYLLTHSNCFAAMSVGSGSTDIISYGLSLYERGPEFGASKLQRVESGGARIGNLWENKVKWIDHASVLHADRVSSPLLMYQCKQDASFFQGIEMFISLRRLIKPAWLLQYDNGGHGLNFNYPEDLKDYTIRYTQFYDHFLKGAPAPRWMTNGIPYKLKGIESRLELEPSGNCGSSGKHCIICDAWNQQYKRNPTMFEKQSAEWSLDKDIAEELERKQKAERARLSKKGLVEQKKIVNVLKNGYSKN